jgi:hypothetical protein
MNKCAWHEQAYIAPQVILERIHKIDKKLSFEKKCSNMVVDSHSWGRLLSILV